VRATTRADGTPQISLVLVAVDDDGRALVSTGETAVKVRNLRRDPRSWLCVLPDGFFGRWVQVEGRAEIVCVPEAVDGLQDYSRRLVGEHENLGRLRRRDAPCVSGAAADQPGARRSGPPADRGSR
jgi:PPOX class probable F420-dependent enzyme